MKVKIASLEFPQIDVKIVSIEECWGDTVKCDGGLKCVNPAYVAVNCSDYIRE